MNPLLRWLVDVASGVGGYAGIFVVSIIGNIVPFMPVPYLAAVYFYASLVPGVNPLLAGVVSGLGATVGKLAIFLAARFSRGAVLSEDSARRYERLGKVIGNYGAIGVFLFAATPSPDDAVIIPLGLMNYSLTKFLAGLLAGKIVISIAVAFAGSVMGHLEEDPLIGFAVAIVAFVVAMILLSLIDWEEILVTLGEGGVRGLISRIRSEGVGAFVIRKHADKAKG